MQNRGFGIAMTARRPRPPDPRYEAELAKLLDYERRWRVIVGENIRQARLGRDLTMEALAVKAHSSKNHIGLVERGVRSPTVDLVCRLAYSLELAPADLLCEPPSPHAKIAQN
jgi:ribosome-binding protein aMBF1 (putative translation factor)